MVIKIKRSGALGDVILTTPIVSEFRRLYPNARIDVLTDCASVFRGNKEVDSVLTSNSSHAADIFIDLDLAYEMKPKMHIIDAYAIKAFNHTEINKTTKLFHTADDMRKVEQLINYHRLSPDKVIVVHPAVSWANRTMSMNKWKEIIHRLFLKGYQIAIVGSGGDYSFEGPGIANLKSKMSINELHYFISRCKAFLGMDSGCLHIAGAADKPVYGIFTCAKGEYRMPFRDNTYIIKPDVNCYGCLHDQTPPVTYVGCKKGNNECLNSFYIDEICKII